MSIIQQNAYDRPDYSPVGLTYSSRLFIGDIIVDSGIATTIGPFEVSGFRWLAGTWFCEIGEFTITVNMLDPKLNGRVLGQFTWGMGESFQGYAYPHIPLNGTQVSIEFNTDSDPFGKFGLFLYASNIPGPTPFVYQGQFLAQSSGTFDVGSTQTVWTQLYGGPAEFAYTTGDGASLEIDYYLGSDNFVTLYDDKPGQAAGQWARETITLPAGACRATLTGTPGDTYAINVTPSHQW